METHLYNNSEKPNNIVKKYLYKLLKLNKSKVNLNFNRTCKRQKIVPKYINVKIQNKSEAAKSAKQKCEKVWLSNSIKILYKKINKLTIEVYNLQLTISKIYHRVQYEQIIEHTKTKIQKIIKKKSKIIKKKLNTLKHNKQSKMINNSEIINMCKTKFNKRIENHTHIEFTNKEKIILEKGSKYIRQPQNNNNEQNKHLLNIENAILKTNPSEQQEIRAVIISEITRNKANFNKAVKTHAVYTEIKTINSIKQKLKVNNAMITKADKGNTLIVINTDDYNNKINEYITNNEIEKLQADPTNEYNKRIKYVISKSINTLSDRSIRFNKMIKPKAPNIRGLPKIHKEGVPIRPLINFTTAPTYRIAKHINTLLKRYIKWDNHNSLKNNIHLVNKIRNIEIPHNAKLASFDITNMYTNIPIGKTIEITKNLLQNNGLKTVDTNEIINLITEITKQNYFTHNREYYKQNIGLPMGSPLSGTLAEIYLNDFEKKYIHNEDNVHKDNIVYWHRYVDDIILLFKGTNRQLDKLHQYINTRQPTIKFTLETEKNKQINFLDLTITNDNSKHAFKIYRKPTQTDQTIHNSSHHPHQHKMAAYNHMIHRLNNIPMNKKDYQEEFNTIKYIASKNGYQHELITKINKKQKAKKHQENLTTLQKQDNRMENKYISVEYNKTTSKAIDKTFKKYGYTTAYKNINKLEQILKHNNNKEAVDTGVYKLTCDNCEKFYIGQTGRSFSTRFKEHVSDLTKKDIKSNYAHHLKTENHKYTDYNKNLTIIHQIKKGNTLDRLEELEIYKNKDNNNLLNDKINTKTNRIYDAIVNNTKNRKGQKQNRNSI